MNLRFCFLTPEQEKSLEKNTLYTSRDRDDLGLLTFGIFDLLGILEIYELDNPGETNHLTSFQTLKHLMEPVYKYFRDTGGVSLENEPENETEEEPE
jgi:hypothetical protein